MTFCAADAMFSAPHPGSPEWQYGVLLDPRKDLVTCLGVGLSVPGAQVLTYPSSGCCSHLLRCEQASSSYR